MLPTAGGLHERGGGGGGSGSSGTGTAAALYDFQQYGSVSHTAISMARGGQPRSSGHPWTAVTPDSSSSSYTSTSSSSLSANGVGGGGSGGWGGAKKGWGGFCAVRGLIPALSAKVRLVKWAVCNSVSNLLNMDRHKSASLGALVLQTSVLALTIRYSRTEVVDGPRYLTSTAVVMSELIKLLACLYMVLHTSSRKGWDAIWAELLDVKEALKTAVPAGIYTLQNNLQFIAVSHLDAATFQVTYQLKILSTAVFSVLFLGRKLDALRWSALVLLTAGVAMVQLPSSDDDEGGAGEGEGTGGESTLMGLTAVLTMCLSSGFAGVYFEKILKSSTQSLWAKNVQMAAFSVILGLLGVVTRDWDHVQQHGFFQGYNALTVFIVLQQAFLGLIISLVMKYADNILKGFASAISIILTSVISYLFLHDLQPKCSFLIGSSVVMGSVLMYNVDRQSPTHTLQTIV